MTPDDPTSTVSKLFLKGAESDSEVEKIGGSNWSVTGNAATIKKEYLSTLTEGAVNLYFRMSDGDDVPFKITVSDTTPENAIAPESATFDINTASENYKNLVFVVTPGNETATISKLYQEKEDDDDFEVEKNGGANWSVTGGLTATAKKEFLATLPEDVYTMYFLMSDGSKAYFEMTVTDTTEASE